MTRLPFFLLVWSFGSSALFATPSSNDTSLTVRATSLAQNEAVVQQYLAWELPRIYLEAGYAVDSAAIASLWGFYQTPFDSTLVPELASIAELQAFIKKNRYLKYDNTWEEEYEFTLKCFPEFPPTYLEFLDDPRIIYTQDIYRCTQIELYRNFTIRVVEEGILQAYYNAGLISSEVKAGIEKIYRRLTGAEAEAFDQYSEDLPAAFKEIIAKHQGEKRRILRLLYGRLKKCNPAYPDNYQDFIEGEKYVLDEKTYACYLASLTEEDLRFYDLRPPKPIDDSEVEGIPDLYEREPDTPDNMVASSQGIGGDLPALTPTTAIIDASAQFLVERTKQELYLAFFEKFEQRLDSMIELRYLFGNTYSLLKNRDYFQIPSLGEGWQMAFEMDLRQMPISFDRLVNETFQYSYFQYSSEYQFFQLANQILQGRSLSLPDLMNRLTLPNWSSANSMMDSTFFLIQQLQQDWQTEYGFLNRQPEVADLKDKAQVFFVALQYHKKPRFYHRLQLKGPAMSAADFMRENPRTFFQKEIKVLNSLAEKNQELKALSLPQRPNIDGYNAAFYQDILDEYLFELPYKLSIAGDALKGVIKTAFIFNYPLDHAGIYADEDYRKITGMIQGGLDLSQAIESREPSRILVASLKSFEPFFLILKQRQQRLIGSLKIRYERAIGEEKNQLGVELEAALNRLQQLKMVGEYLGFYGSFILDILTAKTSEDIKGVLYRYAVPAGSYRQKRESAFTLELGAFPGLFAAREWLPYETDIPAAWVTGVTAPIGFTLSWAGRKGSDLSDQQAYDHTYKKKKVRSRRLNGWSYSIFLPVIDISAPFSYRWTNGNAQGLPENISWEQVLAPGAFVVLGIKKLPISLSAGGQYVPRLRAITPAGGNEVVNADAFRFGINATVDIPIFSFYRK